MRNSDDRISESDNVVSDVSRSTEARTSEQSRIVMRYCFSSDSHLRDLYVDHTGNILTGKLLEDLDALAGNVANKHCCDENLASKRLSLVTASVDEIIQSSPIPTSDDLVLTGYVVWVGKSSLDVNVEIHRARDYDSSAAVPAAREQSRLLSSTFTYVARHRATGKAAMANPLALTTEAEKVLFAQRATAAELRRSQRDTPPVVAIEETEALQRLIEEGSAMQDMPALGHRNAILMKHTGLENSVVCQPQNVNTGGRVFGGFIMHRAFDLALSTSYIFAGAYPIFLEVDKIAFRRPLDIGDLLRLKSRVIYSSANPHHNGVNAMGEAQCTPDLDEVKHRTTANDRPLLVVEVSCQVVRPEKACSFVSNTFYFVFGFPEKSSVCLRKVLPVTTEEATMLMVGATAVESTLCTIVPLN
eukprot:gene13733-15798_t